MKINTEHKGELVVDQFPNLSGTRPPLLQLGVKPKNADKSLFIVLNKMEFEALVAAGREVFKASK